MKIIFIGDAMRERERKSENKMNELIASSKSRDLKFVMIIYIYIYIICLHIINWSMICFQIL